MSLHYGASPRIIQDFLRLISALQTEFLPKGIFTTQEYRYQPSLRRFLCLVLYFPVCCLLLPSSCVWSLSYFPHRIRSSGRVRAQCSVYPTWPTGWKRSCGPENFSDSGPGGMTHHYACVLGVPWSLIVATALKIML